MNKTWLIGYLARDPELRYTGNNTPVATFTLAVKRQMSDETDYIPIVVWNKRGEACGKYLKKGSKLAVLGRIQVRSYEDKEGKKRYVTEIVAEDIQFLDNKKNEGNPFEEFANEIQQEELPF